MSERFLSGKVAWVTGGGSGQGRAAALALAEAGADVAIGSFLSEHAGEGIGEATYYPGRAELLAAAGDMEKAGARVYSAHLDVCSRDSVDGFFSDAVDALGKIDILVNAAGVTAEHPLCGHPEELWLRVLETNLSGAFRTSRCCLPPMTERGWGRIINICSTAGMVGWGDNAAYCASKSGMLGLTRCAGLEGAARGVTVNAISPTWVNTGLMKADMEQIGRAQKKSAEEVAAEFANANPQKRALQPEETAAVVVFLCGEGAKGINAENITLSGGALW